MFWKKKEIKKEIKKRDCKIDKHEYKIMDYNATFCSENGKPTSPIFMLECIHCGKKRISDELFWNYLPKLWEQEEISFKNYYELTKKVTIEKELRVKNWEEKQKPKKSTKKKKKI